MTLWLTVGLGPENPGKTAFNPVCKTSDLLCSFKSKRGETVFHMGRNHLERSAVDQAIAFKPLQCLSQHPFADPSNCSAQLAEAVDTGFKNQQNQHAPSAGDMLEHLARWTRFHQEFSSAHYVEQRSCFVS
ncbi:hypothetical protein P245_03300 [Comamonas thiooxydans]|uniref:Uncharacterized protein n=1 Tax=Comamonas thiooxydans TaxID=363952 RepID=A0A0E3BJB0_9BURK|nr:hypothetical protein P245_03300 [Comamonas thiooxydans]